MLLTFRGGEVEGNIDGYMERKIFLISRDVCWNLLTFIGNESYIFLLCYVRLDVAGCGGVFYRLSHYVTFRAILGYTVLGSCLDSCGGVPDY